MVWRLIETLSSLLDPDERQSVLGDITERGANSRVLFDLIGLVALRQLQAWKSPGTWVLAISLLLPAFAVVLGTGVAADSLSYYPWPDLVRIARFRFFWIEFGSSIGIVALSWSIGFSGASLARHRIVALLVPAMIALIPSLPRTLTDAAALILLIAIPGLLGIRRGWKDEPLSRTSIAGLIIACILTTFVTVSLGGWTDWLLTLAAFWPAFFAMSPPVKEAHS